MMTPAELHNHITFTVTAEDILRADMDYVGGYNPIEHALMRLYPDMVIHADFVRTVDGGTLRSCCFSQEGPEDQVDYELSTPAIEYIDVWNTVRRVHPYTFTISRQREIQP